MAISLAETGPESFSIGGEKVDGKAEEVSKQHLETSLNTKEALKYNSIHPSSQLALLVQLPVQRFVLCSQKATCLWEQVETFSHHLLCTECLFSWKKASAAMGRKAKVS